MAQQANLASTAGPQRSSTSISHNPDLRARRPLSPDAALRLFLKHRRLSSGLDSFDSDSRGSISSKSPSPNSSRGSSPRLSPPLMSSLPPKAIFDQRAKALILQSYLTHSRSVASSQRQSLYRRHRNAERALRLYLFRRQLWRNTRRPTYTMDFIDTLRQLQSDEVSSDEDSCLVLAEAGGIRRDSSSTVSPPPAFEEITSGSKKKLKPVGPLMSGAVEEEDCAITEAKKVTKDAVPAKKQVELSMSSALSSLSSAEEIPKKKPEETPEFKGKNLKRKSDADLESSAGGQPKAKKPKVKTADGQPRPTAKANTEGKPPKPAAAAEVSTSRASSAPAASPTKPPVPARKGKEYFETRVQEMLTDPLGFDDLVYPTTKPLPKHAQQSFARWRRRQRQPPPPLVMSGAIGTVGDDKSPKKGMVEGVGKKKEKEKGKSLEREAMVRAHQMKVRREVAELRERVVNGKKGARVVREESVSVEVAKYTRSA